VDDAEADEPGEEDLDVGVVGVVVEVADLEERAELAGEEATVADREKVDGDPSGKTKTPIRPPFLPSAISTFCWVRRMRRSER